MTCPEAAFLDSPQVLDSVWCLSSRLGLAPSEWSIANAATVRGTGARHTVRSTRRNDALRLFMRSIPKNGPQVDTIFVGLCTSRLVQSFDLATNVSQRISKGFLSSVRQWATTIPWSHCCGGDIQAMWILLLFFVASGANFCRSTETVEPRSAVEGPIAVASVVGLSSGLGQRFVLQLGAGIAACPYRLRTKKLKR